ncbi:heme-binding domain-containing protein [Winogradskyella wichelsiae]|uniref:heme-binding domain-containing protein n=1 Tax=Winogradskyella wichelsiae TaxID=2697007 RepID=UPI0015C742FD|nr:heme-binding domain-containing protein [Winogradskyella wichelsiae]
MKIIKRIGLILLVVLIIAQFFGPQKNVGDTSSLELFYADTHPSENVELILKNACLDCHSDNTRYPWYNNITPVNYWLDEHVKDGVKHLNLSKWDDYSDKKKDHKLDELIEMVEEKEMPLDSYTWIHDEAKLTEAQIEDVTAWAKTVRLKYIFLKDAE